MTTDKIYELQGTAVPESEKEQPTPSYSPVHVAQAALGHSGEQPMEITNIEFIIDYDLPGGLHAVPAHQWARDAADAEDRFLNHRPDIAAGAQVTRIRRA